MQLLEAVNVTSVIIASFEGVVTQTLEMMAGIAPVAISVFAMTFLWKKARAFFTKNA